MQTIINKDDTPGPPPKDIIHPFHIFFTLLNFSSLCCNRSLTISKSAGMNPQFLQILLCFHRFLLSQGLTSPLPSNLITSYLLEAFLHQSVILQTHLFYKLFSLCHQTCKSPPHLKIILYPCDSWWVHFTTFLPPSLSTAKPPAAWLPLCQ